MLRELRVERFRGLDRFAMSGLGRVNLLVGTNNCGKTSLLEAIQILGVRGDPVALWSILSRRGERLEEVPRTAGRMDPEVDVCHLFSGHELTPGAYFAVEGRNDSTSEALLARVVEAAPVEGEGSTTDVRQEALAFDDGEVSLPSRIAMVMRWQHDHLAAQEQIVALSRRGGMRSSTLERVTRRRDDDARVIRLITTASLHRDDIVGLFEAIVLTPEESVLIEALRTIEPTIERIAPLGDRRRGVYIHNNDRGGIVVKCSGSAQRVPIGSMGDGIWRMLGIALCLVRTPNGILLVDEIDTGLHYSVMADMWRLVLRTAQRLNIQVFATTHSRDCYESLAEISRAEVEGQNEISIQRIERGRNEAIAFAEPEIVIAAQRGIEVR